MLQPGPHLHQCLLGDEAAAGGTGHAGRKRLERLLVHIEPGGQLPQFCGGVSDGLGVGGLVLLRLPGGQLPFQLQNLSVQGRVILSRLMVAGAELHQPLFHGFCVQAVKPLGLQLLQRPGERVLAG